MTKRKLKVLILLLLASIANSSFARQNPEIEGFDPNQILRKFNEKDLRNGTGGKSQVRIIMHMSMDKSVMLKWYPEANDHDVSIEARTLSRDGNHLGEQISSKISPSQKKRLKECFGIADPTSLPERDWRSSVDVLDGSTWMIEIASKDECVRRIRTNPMSFPSDFSDLRKIGYDRIWREQFLVTFILNLLMTSNLELDKLY